MTTVRTEARSEYFPREDQAARVNLHWSATDLRRATPSALAPVPPYTPPPLDLLPGALREYVQAGADALASDIGYVLPPLLSALAAAVGNARVIMLKRGFTQPPVIWSAIIGPTGTKKSAAIELGTFALRDRERELTRHNLAEMAKHDKIAAEWESKKKSDRGAQPKPPPNLCCLANDLTLAALAWRLSENPRGIIAVKDELSQFFGAFNQFDHGQGTDLAHYLSLHSGMMFAFDRKTGREVIRIFNPRVCVAGGIQPQILQRCLSPEYFEQGLPARFLFAAPPPQQDRWTEATVPPNVRNAALKVFVGLWALQPGEENGDEEPTPLKLDAGAKSVFVEFYNRVGAQAVDADAAAKAVWNKLTGYAARFALIGQLAQDGQSVCIAAEVMQAACELAGWFGREAERIYALLAEPPGAAGLRRLTDFIARQGGEVTANEAAHNYRPLKGRPDLAEAQLCELVRAGLGVWTPVCSGLKGGKPTRRFRLLADRGGCPCPHNPQEASETIGIRDRDTMKTPQTDPSTPTPTRADATPAEVVGFYADDHSSDKPEKPAIEEEAELFCGTFPSDYTEYPEAEHREQKNREALDIGGTEV
ncbi:MAG: DUF3987 domain-containing protein [Limisphaerales bacterium]